MADFTVYVVGAEAPAGGAPDTAPAEVESMAIRQLLPSVGKKVPASRLLTSFDEVKRTIDAMIERLEAGEKRGFRLDGFEVSLGVSGEGNIGLAKAAANAGIVLKFKRD